MHSAAFRGNALLMYAGSALAILALLASFTDLLHKPHMPWVGGLRRAAMADYSAPYDPQLFALFETMARR